MPGHKLDEKYLGQFKNPEVQRKAKATQARNRALRTREAQIAMREFLGEHLYSLKEAEDIHKAWELYKKVAMEVAQEGDLRPLQWYLDKFVESMGKTEDREVAKEQKSFKEAIDVTDYSTEDSDS